ncbi:MAG: hypothetical protein ACRD2E_11825 [Terriglobales bacterium]
MPGPLAWLNLFAALAAAAFYTFMIRSAVVRGFFLTPTWIPLAFGLALTAVALADLSRPARSDQILGATLFVLSEPFVIIVAGAAWEWWGLLVSLFAPYCVFTCTSPIMAPFRMDIATKPPWYLRGVSGRMRLVLYFCACFAAVATLCALRPTLSRYGDIAHWAAHLL